MIFPFSIAPLVVGYVIHERDFASSLKNPLSLIWSPWVEPVFSKRA